MLQVRCHSFEKEKQRSERPRALTRNWGSKFIWINFKFLELQNFMLGNWRDICIFDLLVWVESINRCC